MTALATAAIGTTIGHVEVGAYRIATDAPESDGAIAGTRRRSWSSRCLPATYVARGYAYADPAAAHLIEGTLAASREAWARLPARAVTSRPRRDQSGTSRPHRDRRRRSPQPAVASTGTMANAKAKRRDR